MEAKYARPPLETETDQNRFAVDECASVLGILKPRVILLWPHYVSGRLSALRCDAAGAKGVY
jgi:hypothetical protein